ncbi:MAG: hypothetical protein FJ288_11800, partial [Planctomycetes bacterium]|nr:hypothetical protein [Planctomycetota bacterium]
MPSRANCKFLLLLAAAVALSLPALVRPATATDSSWNANADGNWSDPTKWTAGVPDAMDDIARLTYNITAARTVTIDSVARTVGALYINDATHGYTLAGVGLNLDVGSGSALIQSDGGTAVTHKISAPVTLNDSTAVAVNSATLQISGVISSGVAETGITKMGAGTLVLSAGNIYTGPTVIAEGCVRASDGVGLPLSSNLVLAGGLFMADATASFTRSLGTGPGQVQWTGSGGFAAWNGKLTVNIGGNASPDTLTWGANHFVPDGCELLLSAGTSYETEFQNPIDLGGAARTVRVGLSEGGTRLATLSGCLSNGGLTKVGPGVLVLKAANTYSGPTTIRSGGTLRVGQADAIPASSAISVEDNGTLDIGAFAVNSGPLTLVNGWVIGTGGVLSAPSFEVRKGTISTSLGGSGGLTKTTGDTVILTGANSYTGPTVIAAGRLFVGNPSALGTTDNGTTVQDGASLELGGSTITGEPLTLMGSGTDLAGALLGFGTWAAPITLAHDSGVTATSSPLILSGPIGDGGAGYGLVTGGSYTTTVLSGANTYTGMTTVIAGTLQLGADNVFADAAPITIGKYPVSGQSSNAQFHISTFSDTVGQVILVNGFISGSGGVLSASHVQLCSGTVKAILGGPGAVIKTHPAGTVSLTEANTYTGTTTVAEGILIVTNANALGATAGGTTVLSGGALEVYYDRQYDTLTMAAEPLTLNGQGVGGKGALRQTAFNIEWTGPVTLGDNAAIGVDFGSGYMSISGAIDDGGLGRGLTKVGSGCLILSGPATYTGPTTITQGILRVIPGTSMSPGNLVFNGGLLQTTGTYTFDRALGNAPGQVQWTAGGGFGARDGPLTVNIGGHSTPDTLIWGSTYFVPDGAELLFTSTESDSAGYLTSNYTTEMVNPIDFGGKNRSVRTGWASSGAEAVLSGALTNGSLTKNGRGRLVLKSPDNSLSAVNVNSGVLILGTHHAVSADADVSVTYNGVDSSFPSLDIGAFNQTVRSLTLDGGDLEGTAGVFTAATYDLRQGWASAILDGANGLTKSTSEDVTLSGKNIYRGVTRVLEGTLSVEGNSPLGSSLEGTVVSDGATLALYNWNGPVTVSDEPLTLYGAGVSGTGALMSHGISGPVPQTAWNGPITLGNDVTIGSWDGSHLTINGVISGPYAITVKGGYASRVVLAAANQYTGLTRVVGAESTLRVTHPLALGPSEAGVIVSAGSLQLDVGITLSGKSLTLNGGRLESVSGNCAWNGPVLLAATSEFLANGNSVLNVNGAMNDGGSGSGINAAASPTGSFAGLICLNAPNQYSGTTTIGSGIIVRAADGVGLPAASNLYLYNGVLGISGGGTFTRPLGSGPGQVRWGYYGGGFSAHGGKAIVNIGGESPTAPLTWNASGFKIGDHYLILGTATADSELEFLNPIDLAGGSRGICVYDNPATDRDFATVSGIISNGSLNKEGGGLLRLTATNTYTGFTNPGNGALRATDGVGLPAASNLKFAGSTGGVLEGEGATVMQRGLGTGAGQVQWTGSGGFSASGGKMTVALGGLAAPTPLVWGSGGFVPGGCTLIFGSLTSDSETEFKNAIDLNGASRTVTVNDNPLSGGDFATLSGILSNGALTKAGTGTLVLSATNTYTGATTIREGALRATQGTGLPSSSNLVFSSGGVYECGGVNFTRSLGTGSGRVQWTYGGGFSAYGGKMTVALGGTANPTALTWGAGNFVRVGAALVFGSATANSETEFINKINLAGAARTVTVIENPFSVGDFATLSGVLSNGGMTKDGAGLLVLKGANTYTGATTVAAGTLKLAATSTMASSLFDVRAGATLDVRDFLGGYTLPPGAALKGGGTVLGGVAASGTVAPGSSAGVLTVDHITFAAGSVLEIEIGGTARGTQYDVLAAGGTVTLQ